MSSLSFCVKDTSSNLLDIINAIEHQVSIHMANLPQTRHKDINWRAKLVLAELRDWC